MVSIGQTYRDTYFDGKRDECTKRTIKITAIDGDKVHAITLTDVRGGKSNRRTKVSIKTLQSGYELVEAS